MRHGMWVASTEFGTHGSAAGGAAALRILRGIPGVEGDGQGSGGGAQRPCTCGPTVEDQPLPVDASQFVDHVIAPRRPG